MHSLLETARLRLDQLTTQHRDLIVRLYTDADVVGGWGAEPYKGTELEGAIDRLTHSWQISGFRQYAVMEKSSENELGLLGIRPGRTDNEGELGYVFAPDAWGSGFAVEASAACNADAFQTLPIDQIIADGITNPRSMRVAEKLGFTYMPNEPVNPKYPDGKLYLLTRNEWEASK